MKKYKSRLLLLLSLAVAIVDPTISQGQSLPGEDAKECSQLTAKDKAYVALVDEFLLPADAKYNTPSWRFDQVTPGIHWRKNGAETDGFLSYRTGWTDGHVRFTVFGPLAGLDWLAYRTSTNASPVESRFKCSGYDLTPIEGPEGTTAYRGHKDDKQDFLLVNDGNLEAICLTTNHHFLKHPGVPHSGEWCRFTELRTIFEQHTSTTTK